MGLYSDPISAIANSAAPGGTAYSAIYNPKIWAAKGIKAREPVKLLEKYAVDYSDDVRGLGDTINIQTIANLVANAKVDQTQVTLQQPIGTNVQLTINRYYETSFLVERVQSEQSKLDLQSEYTPKAVEIIERKKDSDLASLYTSAATQIGTSGTAFSDANFLVGVQTLDTANVPEEGRHLIVKPTARQALLSLDKYLGVIIGNDGSGSNGVGQTKPIVNTGLFGEIYGMPVNMSTNLVNSSGNHNLLFHESAMAVAVQIDTIIDQDWVQPYLGWLTTGSGLWGRALIRTDHLVDFVTN